MYAKIKKLEEGFTIVEVLIVLAIAALILAIVLIAVPDLQRSSRNSNILHDAQNVASAVQSYEGNNQGQIPYYQTGAFVAPAPNPATNSATFTVGYSTAANPAATAQGHVQSSDSIFVSNGAQTVTFGAVGTPASATNVAQGDITVDLETNCPTAPGNSVKTTANLRGVAVLYPIEGSSQAGSSVACVQE